MRDKNGRLLSFKETILKVFRRADAIILEFEVMLLRLVGYIPFHSVRLLFYKMAGIKIGRGSTIHMFASFYDPGKIEIGEDSTIGERAVLDGRAKIIIGDHVDIASEVMIYNAEHDINDENFRPIFRDVIINDYVFIGPRAIILPDIKIGKGAIVAAGAVVTKKVEDLSVVAGIPAKKISERKLKDFHYKLGRAAWFR